MTKTLRIVLVAFTCCVVLLGAAAWTLSRLDVKSRFESAASRATGLQVTVNGKSVVHLLPTLHVSLSEVTATKSDRKIASIGEADVNAEYLPLLRKKIVLRSVRLRDVEIDLERDRDGRLNIQQSSGDHSIGSIHIGHVSFANASFRYTNHKVEKFFAASGCTIDDEDLQLDEGRSADIMKHLAISARVGCKEMRNNRFVGSDVQLRVAGKDGKLKFAPIELEMMGGKGSAVIDGDYLGEIPSYQVHYEISQLQVGELFKSIAPKKTGTGRLDFSADLSLRGFNVIELTRTADGVATLRGKDFELAIGDLDEKLRRFKSTQSFDLLDIGAFLIAGPIGPAVTKGYEFATAMQASEGNTHVNTFVSQWKVEKGVAHAVDVAMTTKENTVAMKGALDFTKKEYDSVTVAALDGSGCVRIDQKINGPFGKPDIQKPDVLKSVAGPIRHLVEKVKDMTGNKCAPFYETVANRKASGERD